MAHAKANPGKLSYASAGPGSTNHLCAAMFCRMAGIEMVHVPYRGGAPAVLDTVAGQVQLFFSAGTQTLPHVREEGCACWRSPRSTAAPCCRRCRRWRRHCPATPWRCGTACSARAACCRRWWRG
ncbi:tripartite tricarboxylate transporter substrate-binding protein [Dankookia sp. P2]|uniref:tripartite tricarboxylate transporter substrate-binding protein n=1 Tax=Dankookia sp. P2 TaxID=3423955 RepID=UPI003D670669